MAGDNESEIITQLGEGLPTNGKYPCNLSPPESRKVYNWSEPLK
jgi:hypothetical protein